MTKFKKRKEEQLQQQNEQNAEDFGKITRKTRKAKVVRNVQVKEDSAMSHENSNPSSPNSSSTDDADEFPFNETKNRRKSQRPMKNLNRMRCHDVNMFDSEFWMKIKTCCGIMYENQAFGALVVDANQYSSDVCQNHCKKAPTVQCSPPPTIDSLRIPVIKSLPPKKQHVLRHCMTEAPINLAFAPADKVQSAPIDYSTSAAPSTLDTPTIARVEYSLTANSVIAGKVVKKSMNRLTPSRSKILENLVKFCTDKTASKVLLANKKTTSNKTNIININVSDRKEAIMVNEHNENEYTAAAEVEGTAGKFSDSSSDSGYDESLHDAAQLNRIAKIGSARPVILSNGVKLHVQPENLLLAANLAGVSQSAIQTTQVGFSRFNAIFYEKVIFYKNKNTMIFRSVKIFVFFFISQANMMAMNQQHFLFLRPENSVATPNTVISPIINQPNNKCIIPTDNLKERTTKKSVYIIKQNVLTVANNN